jgi:GTP-binding protein HflX
LESDRRRIRKRIRHLRQSIERVRTERSLHREHRRRQQFLTVALVGYTNAGKSTLFNAITSSRVLVSSQLFATLDPTIRLLRLPSRRRVLVSDTVGFIRSLPPYLVTALRATLEELQDAALLLQVMDTSDPARREKQAAVEDLLASLELVNVPRLCIWNKADLLKEEDRQRLLRNPSAVVVSAVTGEGLAEMIKQIDSALMEDPLIETELQIPADDGRLLAIVCRQGRILGQHLDGTRLVLRASLPKSVHERIRSSFPDAEKVLPHR